MADSDRRKRVRESPRGQSSPPGRTRIMEALKALLAEKEFSVITTAEIASRAQVTEPLIYKYFRDKRDLLHRILTEYLRRYLDRMKYDLKGVKGSLNKLRKLIWTHANMYATDRVFARILIVEVRNHKDYFNSDAYGMVKQYTDILLEIVEEGVDRGEIRSDIPAKVVRRFVLGAIEHACLSGVIFDRALSPDRITEQLCEMIFHGIVADSPDGSEDGRRE
jgi:AcrR family transcriptional regulator